MFSRTAALIALAALAPAAVADPVFETNNPFGGFLGINGFDVFQHQSVAARFIPNGSYTLDSISIWFMSNDDQGTTPQTVTITLRTDVNPGGEFTSIPSETILESWTTDLPVVGWDPQLIAFDSNTHVALTSGQKYWVVAESDVAPMVDPVWCWSSSGNEFTATTDGAGTPWESGSGAALALVVSGTVVTPPCAPDIGAQGGVAGHDGALDNNDFVVFIDYFFNQHDNADVGSTGGIPGADDAWDNNDFVVFIDMFFAGC
ncbi:MAG TPA: GC-type dockerin domain-anchored protein [Phycisphaerales bacterium]|nr:GC-type dockerin domain-anchored protein [Phycisphaerales bacterium]